MDSHNILNVRNISDVMGTEVHTTELLVPGSSNLEVEISIAKLENYKSPDSDQIPAQLIQAGGKILLSAFHKLINSLSNTEELPHKWKRSVSIPVQKRVTKLTVIFIV
jgi:hypothetical protein